jgi:hypothetical protein
MSDMERESRAPLADHDGFVIPAVVFALVVMSLLAVAALLTAVDEQRASRAMRESSVALYTAEAGMNEVWATWPDSLVKTLNPGDSLDLGWRTLDNGASYRAVIHRYDNGGQRVFGLLVDGRGAGPLGGQRSVAMYFSEPRPKVEDFARATVTTLGPMEAVSDPTSTIDGNDGSPPGWLCNGYLPGSALPGIVVQDSGDISQGPGTILGDPPILVDPTIGSATFTQFGDFTYSDLVAMADKTYPPNSQPGYFGPVVDGNGQCDTSVQSNWGDPLNPGSPCSEYFPIIHFTGDVEFTTTGSAGQGILLTDGNLYVGGGDFTFYGLIIVQGACVFEYESKVFGGVLCANQANLNQEIGDAAPLSYSSCALSAALRGAGVTSGPPQPLVRGWAEPFN